MPEPRSAPSRTGERRPGLAGSARSRTSMDTHCVPLRCGDYLVGCGSGLGREANARGQEVGG